MNCTKDKNMIYYELINKANDDELLVADDVNRLGWIWSVGEIYKIEKNGDIYVLRCIKNDYKDQIKFIGKNYEHVMVEHNACLSRITNIEQKKESWKLEKNNELDSLLRKLGIEA